MSQPYKIKKIAILGSGVMGSQIAAHLANAGYPSYLLDIVPNELTPEEEAAGLTLTDRKVRNRIVSNGLKMALKLKPAPFYDTGLTSLITIGNFEDNFNWLAEVDCIIEAVVERLDIKQSLMQKIAEVRKPGTIIATNTSGISLTKIAENQDHEFKRHFVGIHFFNPPRYMRLLEIIPTADTDTGLVDFMADFVDRQLGKGVVFCQDTPNFIGNRIGVMAMMIVIQQMIKDGLTIDEVDAITGPATGKPKSATFRTADVVGIDTFVHVAKNLYEAAPEDEMRDQLLIPDFVNEMVKKGWLGSKTKQGFYRKGMDASGKRLIFALNPDKMEFEPTRKVSFPSLDASKKIDDVGERIKSIAYADDKAGKFFWETLSAILIYSANRIPEITDSIMNIDNAMKWGYNWELGLFETWDAIDLQKSVNRMVSEGKVVPDNIKQMLAAGNTSFYKTENGILRQFDFNSREYKEVEFSPGIINLNLQKESPGKVLITNEEASLIDLGDGVALVEFHSKMNSIGEGILGMVNQAVDVVEKNYDGLVIGNQGSNFSVGANLFLVAQLAQNKDWDGLEQAVKLFQNTSMRLKYAEKPVVVAPFGMTLGGGCELQMHAARTQASAESYIGLVEVGVGLIPAAGGTKELTLRTLKSVENIQNVDYNSFIQKVFETIGMAKVSTSAVEAKKMNLLRNSDLISINPARLIGDAKQTVLNLVSEGYRNPAVQERMLALGSKVLSRLLIGIDNMHEAGFITDYDRVVGEKLAFVIAGGNLTAPQEVNEQYFLDLEREAFLSLCGEQGTQERIMHMLKTGKPLRN